MSSNASTRRTGPVSIPFSRIMTDVSARGLKFVILDCPTENNLHLYIQELKERGATDVVRLCEPTYSKEILNENGINVLDLSVKDGGIPAPNVLQTFLQLCEERFGPFGNEVQESTPQSDNLPTIAVHCVAGLGRAPVMVAIALIERGLEPLEAVELIRKKRRGAFNSVQLTYLMDQYKRQTNKKKKQW